MPHPIKAVAGLCVTALALSLAAGTARAVPTADPTTTATTTPTSTTTPDTYTWSCDTNPGFIAVDDNDRVWHYGTTKFGTNEAVHTGPKQISINAKGHVLHAGRDGVIFSWHDNNLYLHTSDDGINYRRQELKDPNGKSEAWRGISAANQARLTVDADNNIYMASGKSLVLRYTWDFKNNRWATWRGHMWFTGKVDGNITELVASGNTSFFIESASGRQYKMTYDAPTRRLLTDAVRIGHGWQTVTHESSGDANTIVGVSKDKLLLYRYDGQNQGVVHQRAIGNANWNKMKQVSMFHGHCTNNDPHVSVPTPEWAPPTVMSAVGHPQDNKAAIGYVNARGYLTFGNVTNTNEPSWDSTLNWQVIREDQAYFGATSMTYSLGGARVLVSRNRSNHVIVHAENPIKGDLVHRQDMGGGFRTQPTVVHVPELGKLFLVGLADDGAVWVSSTMFQRSGSIDVSTDAGSWHHRFQDARIRSDVQPFVETRGTESHIYVATENSVLHLTLDVRTYSIVEHEELPAIPEGASIRGLTAASLSHGATRVVATMKDGTAHVVAQNPFGGWAKKWTALDFDGATVLGNVTITYDPHGVLSHIFARTAGEPGEPKKLWQASESIDVPGEYRRPTTLAEGHFTYDPTPLTVNTSAGVRFGAVAMEGTQARYWASKPVQVNPMWWAHRSTIPELTILRAQANLEARAQLADVEFTPVAKFGVKQ